MSRPIAPGRLGLPPNFKDETKENAKIDPKVREAFKEVLKSIDTIRPQNVKKTYNRDEIDPQVLKAAQSMETYFVDLMMKTMRKTVPENEFSMNSSATKIYQNMLDNEVAQKAVRTQGIGLTDTIIESFEAQGYNIKKKPGESTEGSKK